MEFISISWILYAKLKLLSNLDLGYIFGSPFWFCVLSYLLWTAADAVQKPIPLLMAARIWLSTVIIISANILLKH